MEVMMKKLLLVLSLLSIVVVQAAEAEDFVVVPQLSLREQIQRDKAEIVRITFTKPTLIDESLVDSTEKSVWELKATYNIICALFSGETFRIDTYDKNYIKAIVEHGGSKEGLLQVAENALKERNQRYNSCNELVKKFKEKRRRYHESWEKGSKPVYREIKEFAHKIGLDETEERLKNAQANLDFLKSAFAK